METQEIIKALPNLSIDDRLTIATIALNSIVEGRRTISESNSQISTDLQLRIAANLAIDDYTNDRELTIFKSLDGEDFLIYEPDYAANCALIADDRIITQNLVQRRSKLLERGDRVIALSSGGAFLGVLIAQIPGAIIGGLFVGIYAWFSGSNVKADGNN